MLDAILTGISTLSAPIPSDNVLRLVKQRREAYAVKLSFLAEFRRRPKVPYRRRAGGATAPRAASCRG
jgi:hypothetical protein